MPRWKGLVIIVVTHASLASWQPVGRKCHGYMYLLQEREVQFAAQCDLQQAVAQNLQGDFWSLGIFYDQPMGDMGVMGLAPCVSEVARVGADTRSGGESFGAACPCPLDCQRPQNSLPVSKLGGQSIPFSGQPLTHQGL